MISLCVRFVRNLLSHNKAPGRKVWRCQLVKNHEESVLWETLQS